MDTHIRGVYKRRILLSLTAAICISVFVITFGNNKNIPTWGDLTRLFGFYPSHSLSDDYIRVLDVGQGDGILISSNGKTALVDTGPPEMQQTICDKLKANGAKNLDAVLITHYHIDHVGGLDNVANNFSIKNLILPEMLSEQEGTKAALIARDIVRASKGGTYTAKQGMYLNIGDFEITVIGYFEDMIDENDRTVIMMAEIDGVRFLLMGDAEKAAESMLLDEDLDLSCDVLKVAHHGSRSSTTSRFLRRTDPKYAVISSGKGNQFSHPHKETLETLKNSRAKVYRTDVSGDVTFYVKDGKITVTTEK